MNNETQTENAYLGALAEALELTSDAPTTVLASYMVDPTAYLETLSAKFDA